MIRSSTSPWPRACATPRAAGAAANPCSLPRSWSGTCCGQACRQSSSFGGGGGSAFGSLLSLSCQSFHSRSRSRIPSRRPSRRPSLRPFSRSRFKNVMVTPSSPTMTAARAVPTDAVRVVAWYMTSTSPRAIADRIASSNASTRYTVTTTEYVSRYHRNLPGDASGLTRALHRATFPCPGAVRVAPAARQRNEPSSRCRSLPTAWRPSAYRTSWSWRSLLITELLPPEREVADRQQGSPVIARDWPWRFNAERRPQVFDRFLWSSLPGPAIWCLRARKAPWSMPSWSPYAQP